MRKERYVYWRRRREALERPAALFTVECLIVETDSSLEIQLKVSGRTGAEGLREGLVLKVLGKDRC